MDQDREHLKLLAIFHYVVAGVTALFALFPLIQLVIGIGIVTGPFNASRDPGAGLFVWLFTIFALVFILGGLAFSVCLALAGSYIAKYRHYTYCLVVAAVSCVFFPFGTVLGIFTILVLSRDSVKRLFRKEAALPEVA